MFKPNLIRRSTVCGLALLASSLAPAADFQMSGPYTHDNLSVYLLHAKPINTGARLLTLQEAMEQHKVVVFETGQVNQLSIENQSSQDVYIQSGDIVKGGRQDRVLTTDLVLPAHSGKLPIAAFCVEHGRWTRRGNEQDGQFSTSNAALPNKALKMAVREEKNQSRVWSEVAQTQMKLAANAGLRAAAVPSPSPTSMQLALENKQVAAQTAAYVSALSRILDGKNDVIGYAHVINGRLNSADVYASPDLFRRMWPKLLQATAAEALSERNADKAPAPNAAALKAALVSADQGHEVSNDSIGRVSVVKKVSDKLILFETRDAQDSTGWIHKSYTAK